MTIALGFLAIESLVERAGEAAILDYFRLLPASARLARGLRGGVRPQRSGTSTRPSRPPAPRVAPLLPHLADDLDEPVFVFLGDVAAEVREELRDSLEASRELFAAQFGSEASDFTVYVGSDVDAVAAEYLAIRGRENPDLCGDHDHNVIFQVTSCKERSLVLAHEYVHVLQHQLAAGAAWGPAWLSEGVAVYGEALHRAVDRARPHGERGTGRAPKRRGGAPRSPRRSPPAAQPRDGR